MQPISQVPIQGMVNANGVGIHFSLEVRDVDLVNCTIKAFLLISALIPGKVPLGVPTVIFQREETYNVPGISPHTPLTGRTSFPTPGAGAIAVSLPGSPQTPGEHPAMPAFGLPLPEVKSPAALAGVGAERTPAVPTVEGALNEGNTTEAHHLKSLHAAVDQLTIALGQIGRTA